MGFARVQYLRQRQAGSATLLMLCTCGAWWGGGSLHNNQMVGGSERLGRRYALAALRACSAMRLLLGLHPRRTRRGLVGAGSKLGLRPWPVSAAAAGKEHYNALGGGVGSTQQSNGWGVGEVGAANELKNEDWRRAERRKKWSLVDGVKYGCWQWMHNDKESCYLKRKVHPGG